MRETYRIAKEYAQRVHDAAGCTYGEDNVNYMVHLQMVADFVESYSTIFKYANDYYDTLAAAYTHDTIEDTQQTFYDVMEATNRDVAVITLAVTDIPAENRMLRFLLTSPKIVGDARSLVLKVCDIAANSSYGRDVKNGMFKKYQKEWKYKRHIFMTAVNWYPDQLDKDSFIELIQFIDDTVKVY